MNIVVIDNYDSFTYNLVQILKDLDIGHVDVFRNDQYQIDEIDYADVIVLSPGPGLPEQAGLLMETIKRYWTSKAILGVCLGHQAICSFFGGALRCLDTVYHGISTSIEVDSNSMYFEGFPSRIDVGRYHSWVVDQHSVFKPLLPIAMDDHGEIMAVCHSDKPILGLQFHPESIMTPMGKKIIQQFIESIKQIEQHEREEQVYT